jgi:Ubiquitin carboxyl-terminal hydrolase
MGHHVAAADAVLVSYLGNRCKDLSRAALETRVANSTVLGACTSHALARLTREQLCALDWALDAHKAAGPAPAGAHCSAPPVKRLLRFDSDSCYADTLVVALLTLPGLDAVRQALLATKLSPLATVPSQRAKEQQLMQQRALAVREELRVVKDYLLRSARPARPASGTLATLRWHLQRLAAQYREAHGTRSLLATDFTRGQADPVDVLDLLDGTLGLGTSDVLTTQGEQLPFYSPRNHLTAPAQPPPPKASGQGGGANGGGASGPASGAASVREYLQKQTDIAYANALYLPVQRIGPDRLAPSGVARLEGWVLPEEELRVGVDVNNALAQPLRLAAVVLHHGSAQGGHYTALLRYGACWYHYDDLRKPLQLVAVGAYGDMLKYGGGMALTDSAAVIYTRH